MTTYVATSTYVATFRRIDRPSIETRIGVRAASEEEATRRAPAAFEICYGGGATKMGFVLVGVEEAVEDVCW